MGAPQLPVYLRLDHYPDRNSYRPTADRMSLAGDFDMTEMMGDLDDLDDSDDSYLDVQPIAKRRHQLDDEQWIVKL